MRYPKGFKFYLNDTTISCVIVDEHLTFEGVEDEFYLVKEIGTGKYHSISHIEDASIIRFIVDSSRHQS